MNSSAVVSVNIDNIKAHLYELWIWYLATPGLFSIHAREGQRPVLKSR